MGPSLLGLLRRGQQQLQWLMQAEAAISATGRRAADPFQGPVHLLRRRSLLIITWSLRMILPLEPV